MLSVSLTQKVSLFQVCGNILGDQPNTRPPECSTSSYPSSHRKHCELPAGAKLPKEHDVQVRVVAGLRFHTGGQAERFLSEKEPELFEFRRRLYEREVAVRYRPGTALIYRHDLWVSTGAN